MVHCFALSAVFCLHSYFVVHCVMVDWKSSYTCLQVVLLLHILNVLAPLEPFANKICHFDHECHCFGLCVNCFENVEFELTAASKQSRKTVIAACTSSLATDQSNQQRFMSPEGTYLLGFG